MKIKDSLSRPKAVESKVLSSLEPQLKGKKKKHFSSGRIDLNKEVSAMQYQSN